MRIVGGKFKGLHLATPSDQATRPTSDRVREAVFNILAHGIAGLELEGARVLDLFAGTGALGFEALSRGARYCQFVDESAEARGLVRHQCGQARRHRPVQDLAAGCNGSRPLRAAAQV